MASDGAGVGGFRRSPPLLLLLLFSCFGCHGVSSKGVQPKCHTDYDTEVVCHWEVDASTNCTDSFRLLLHVKRFHPLDPDFATGCTPENERGPDTIPKCTCTCIIPQKMFERVTYDFSLEANRTEIWNRTVDPADLVKPRALVNLTVQRKENRMFLLTWSRDYRPRNPLYNENRAEYEVAYWPKDQRDQECSFQEVQSSYKIFADHLTPAATYVARVRHRFKLYGNTWSEWSAPQEWLNNFGSSHDNVLWNSILGLCLLIMVLVVICYLCFVRVKRKWWDQIPSPAKSKVAENMTVKPVSFVRKVCSAVEGKQHLQDTHKLDSQSKIDVTFCSQPTRGKVPKNSPGGKQEVFLTPEVTVVEYPVLIYRHESDAKPEAPEAEADWVPHEDAVARLFRVLLSGELSMGGTSILEPLAQEEQSPTEGQAPERMPSAVGLWQDVPLGKPQGSLESSSESGYRSSSTEAATSSRAASPDPEQLLGHGLCPSAVQPSVLLLPPHESDHAFATVRIGPLEEGSSAVPSGYKCFNSFVSEPLANFSQLLPPQWEGNPEAPPQNAPGKADTLPCPVAALLSGYRSFSSALQSSPKSPQGRRSSSSLDLQSPYKPLQSCQEQPPTNSPCGQNPFSPRLGGPGDPAWPRAPWEADLGMRESTAGGGFKRGAARDRGLLCP